MDSLPSATDILRFYHCYDKYGGVISPEVQFLAMLRGSRVDKAAEFMALGAGLDAAHCAGHIVEYATRRERGTTLEQRAKEIEEANRIAFGKQTERDWIEANKECVCMGFLQAAAKFLAEHPLTLVAAQFEVINKKLGYIGHPDWLVKKHGRHELLSIKTGDLPNFAGIQEALYLLADPLEFSWPVKGRLDMTRAVVQFRADGGYTYKPLTDYRDFSDAEILAAGFHVARRINGENE